jgi:hypothetical protein
VAPDEHNTVPGSLSTPVLSPLESCSHFPPHVKLAHFTGTTAARIIAAERALLAGSAGTTRAPTARRCRSPGPSPVAPQPALGSSPSSTTAAMLVSHSQPGHARMPWPPSPMTTAPFAGARCQRCLPLALYRATISPPSLARPSAPSRAGAAVLSIVVLGPRVFSLQPPLALTPTATLPVVDAEPGLLLPLCRPRHCPQAGGPHQGEVPRPLLCRPFPAGQHSGDHGAPPPLAFGALQPIA